MMERYRLDPRCVRAEQVIWMEICGGSSRGRHHVFHDAPRDVQPPQHRGDAARLDPSQVVRLVVEPVRRACTRMNDLCHMGLERQHVGPWLRAPPANALRLWVAGATPIPAAGAAWRLTGGHTTLATTMRANWPDRQGRLGGGWRWLFRRWGGRGRSDRGRRGAHRKALVACHRAVGRAQAPTHAVLPLLQGDARRDVTIAID